MYSCNSVFDRFSSSSRFWSHFMTSGAAYSPRVQPCLFSLELLSFVATGWEGRVCQLDMTCEPTSKYSQFLQAIQLLICLPFFWDVQAWKFCWSPAELVALPASVLIVAATAVFETPCFVRSSAFVSWSLFNARCSRSSFQMASEGSWLCVSSILAITSFFSFV